ncbi:DUF4233 domain-containing protein [Streptomyces sp. DSM 44915]|uniref:DUF4233 domain-containing protein n=1 Tax=Streptomyces chisholmiae TaxID=3075540 RepID=A0ABU2JXC7_9ACTN|nr:DUF4233 domain-containing protein [Streptomyces sp. DSM 44915]MDT0269179.1 DUF4233 domain-containing protein [Streptomyces sp. DSM 44915]
MRTLCASTLVGEFLVIGLAGLAATRLSSASTGTIWWVCGIAMAFCLVLCAIAGRPLGVWLGWALQVGLFASGLVLPAMFVLGIAFGGLWWTSVHFGARIDELRAAREAGAAAG